MSETPASAASQPTRLTGAEIVWATLEGEGVREVFGYPGGAILPVYDALRKYPIRHILVRHEQSAAHAADGYARASGKVGVAVATSGPGATNLVTGIATAMMDSMPLVCITGQISSKLLGTDAFQEVDITGVTLPITKHNYIVTRARGYCPGAARGFPGGAVGTSGAGAGGHHQGCAAGTGGFRFCRRRATPHRPHPMLSAEKEAHQRGHRADSFGQAANHSGRSRHSWNPAPWTRFARLAERLQIPVASTLLGLGAFPASHELSLGMMGMHGEAWVNQAIQQSDLLIACGMRFDDRVTGVLTSYAPNAKKIHIEIDPAEINKNVKADVALIGDLREILEDDTAAHCAAQGLHLDRSGQRAEGRRRGARHQEPAGPRAPVRRPRDPRPVARHRRQGASS